MSNSNFGILKLMYELCKLKIRCGCGCSAWSQYTIQITVLVLGIGLIAGVLSDKSSSSSAKTIFYPEFGFMGPVATEVGHCIIFEGLCNS